MKALLPESNLMVMSPLHATTVKTLLRLDLSIANENHVLKVLIGH
jgi:hypothetical protein